MGKLYKLFNLKKVSFIDKGVLGDVFKTDGTKYYTIICDLRWEADLFDFIELGDVIFTMKQDELDLFLQSKVVSYDKESQIFEVVAN